MKFLARSFLIDITLVAVACFMLVCAVAYLRHVSAQIEAGQHAYWVEINHADGSVEKYRVDETSQSAVELHEGLVQRMMGRPASQVALMQWYQESSHFYAAASSRTVIDEMATKQAGLTMAADVFHTASSRQPDQLPNPATGQAYADDASSRWRDFWNRREERASVWLAGQEANAKTRLASLRQSIRVVERHSWLPTAQTNKTATLLSVLVVAAGCLWRFACPPRSLHRDQVTFPGLPSKPAGSNTAAMYFRPSWVKTRQPGSVIVRGALGWAISIAALGCLACAVVSSLS